MSQHDFEITAADANTGQAMRAEINAALQALAGNSASATEPATKYPYQFWADTTTGLLKQRNAANSAWITFVPDANIVETYTDATVLKTCQDITDINTVRKTGLYKGHNVANGITGYWFYFVLAWDNAFTVKVLAYNISTAETWTKQAAGGTWGAWVQLTNATGDAVRAGFFHGRVAANGTAIRLPTGWTSSKTATGTYLITHNIGNTNYTPMANALNSSGIAANVYTTGTNTLVVSSIGISSAGVVDGAFTILVFLD